MIESELKKKILEVIKDVTSAYDFIDDKKPICLLKDMDTFWP